MKKRNSLVLLLIAVLTVMMVVSVMPVSAISVALESVAPSGEEANAPASAGKISVDTGNPAIDDSVPVGNPGPDYTPSGTGITTTEQFNNMDPAGSYYLAADITVDTTFAGFSGVFDGNGHTVTTSVSLFNSPQGATIKNLVIAGSVTTQNTTNTNNGNTGTVTNGTAYGCNFFNIRNTANVSVPDPRPDTETEHRASGLVGRTGGYTVIERCVNEGNVTGYGLTSGIVMLASADNGSELVMVNCVNKGAVTTGSGTVGGVACSVECPDVAAIIYQCRNEGAVTGNGVTGGVVGITIVSGNGMGSIRLADCTNAGVITAGENYAGGIIGSSYTPVTIENCTNEATGKVYAGHTSTSNQRQAAGIIGHSGNVAVLITDCVNHADIEGSGQSGGIAGWMNSTNVTLRNCTNNGEVTSRLNYCGGIVGRTDISAAATDLDILIEDCTNTGKVSAYAGNVGGIYGFTQANVTFIRCTNTGEVTYRADSPDANGTNAGGIAGAVQGPAVFEDCRNEGNVTAKAVVPFTANTGGNAGGIAGSLGSSGAMGSHKLYRCVNTGNVTGGLGVTPTSSYACYAGGFIGYQYCSSSYSRPEITYCMSTGDVTAANQVSYGIGYMNGTAALFTDNVFAGTLTSEGFPSGQNASGSPVRSILAWNNGFTIPAGHYTRNYVVNTFDGAVINNKAATGAGTPVTMADYAYTYTPETDPVDVYEALLAGAEEEISTPEQFANMKADGRYKLTANITLTATYATAFSGVLNGNGKTLTVSAPVFAMLYSTAEVKDLTLAGEITGMTGQVGALVKEGGGRITRVVNRVNVTASGGNIGGFIGRCNGQFAYFTDCVNDGNVNVSSANNAAGFIGYTDYTSYFINCTNNGEIKGGNHVGGIVAESQVWGTTYIGCVNTGMITNTYTGTAGKGTGGIQGYNGNNCVYLTDCFNSGKITGTYAAGMVGDSAKGAHITGCINTGEIFSTKICAGGIMNHHEDTGCLAENMKFTNCVNTGYIHGTGSVGGIVGSFASLHIATQTTEKITASDGKTYTRSIKATALTDQFIYFTACINAGKVEGASNTGGIIGNIKNYKDANATTKFPTGVTYTENEKEYTTYTTYIVVAPKGNVVLKSCVQVGEVICTGTGSNVGGLIGYTWGSSGNFGIDVTNCIIAGSVTASGDRCGAIAGYMNADKAIIKNNVIATTLTAGTATHLYYGSNGAAITAKANIANNAVKPGSAMYDAQKGNGATTYALGEQSTGTVDMNDFAIDSTVTKNMLLIAGIAPDADGNFGAALNRLFSDESTTNLVAVYNAEDTLVATVTSLALAEAYVTDGCTVKLLADYYSADIARIAPRGVNWTLDGNGYAMYFAANGTNYVLKLSGDGSTLTAENLKVYAQGYGVRVGTNNDMTMDVTFHNAVIYAGSRNENGYVRYTEGTAVAITGDHANLKLTGAGTTIGNSSQTLLYVCGGLDVEDGTFNSRAASALYIVNSKGGMPVTLRGGTYTNYGHIINIVGVTDERTIEVYGGTYTCTSGNNCIIFGTNYTRANVTMRIFGGDFKNEANGNLITGWNATSNGKVGGTPIEGSNGTLEVYGGTFTKAGTSRMIKYYGNQNFYLYGGTFVSTSDDIIAFGLSSGVSADYKTESHIIFGTPADLVVPDGVTVQPLNVESIQSLFYCDSLHDEGVITIDIYSGTLTTAATDAGISVLGNSAVHMHGGNITMTDKGGMFQLRGNADLTVSGGTMTHEAAAIADQNWKCNIILVEKNYTGDILVEGGVMTGNNCGFYLNAPISAGTLTMTGGEMTTVKETLYTQATADVDVYLTGGKLTSTAANAVHVCSAADIADPDAFDELTAKTFLIGGTVELSAKSNAVYLGQSRPYVLTVDGGTLTASTALNIQTSGKLIINDMTAVTTGTAIFLYNLNYVEINDADITVTGNAYALQSASARTTSGETITKRSYAPKKIVINGGTFVCQGTGDTALSFEGTYDSNTEVIINGGYFENKGMCVARVLAGKTKNEAGADNTIVTETGTNMTIKGGVFVAASGNNAAHCAVVRCGGGSTYGTVIIEGGTFINQKAKSEQVIYKNNTCSTLMITGGKFLASADQVYFMNTNGNADVTTEGGYTPACSHGDVATSAYSGTMTYADATYKLWTIFGATNDAYAMETLAGAQVRMTTGSTGLRFISVLSAEKVAAALALAGEGGTVSYGTVIAPMDFVVYASAFTMEALDAAEELKGFASKYADIPASVGLTENEDGSVEIRAALTNIREVNYTRAFAAVAYVRVETAEGVVTYFYGEFDAVNNVRAIRQVAEAALADMSETKTDVYRYVVYDTDGVTVLGYSKYGPNAREVLKSFVG